MYIVFKLAFPIENTNNNMNTHFGLQFYTVTEL